MEGQTRMMETPEGTPLAAASLTLERMTVTAVEKPVSRCHRGGFAVAILPGTAERDEPPVSSAQDQSDWNPPLSPCLIDWQVAEVQQTVVTMTRRGDDRQAQREARMAVKYRTAAGRLTAT